MNQEMARLETEARNLLDNEFFLWLLEEERGRREADMEAALIGGDVTSIALATARHSALLSFKRTVVGYANMYEENVNE